MPVESVQLPRRRVWIRAEFLHNGDPSRRFDLVPGVLLDVTSYPGHAPTFTLAVDTGWLGASGDFHYLPVEALRWCPFGPCAAPTRTSLAPAPGTRTYHRALSGPVSILHGRRLDEPCWLWTADRQPWMRGWHVLTLEWTDANVVLYLLRCFDGTMALWPPHKITWGKRRPDALPSWKKMRQEHPARAFKDEGYLEGLREAEARAKALLSKWQALVEAPQAGVAPWSRPGETGIKAVGEVLAAIREAQQEGP